MSQSKKNVVSIEEPIEVKPRGGASYRIYPADSFDGLGLRLEELESSGCRVCVVTDSNVEKLYLKEVKKALSGFCKKLTTFTITAGEVYKNLDEIRKLYVHLIEHDFDRRDILVALGGGVRPGGASRCRELGGARPFVGPPRRAEDRSPDTSPGNQRIYPP